MVSMKRKRKAMLKPVVPICDRKSVIDRLSLTGGSRPMLTDKVFGIDLRINLRPKNRRYLVEDDILTFTNGRRCTEEFLFYLFEL